MGSYRSLALAALGGLLLGEAHAEPPARVTVCTVRVRGVLGLDRPGLERALDEALRYAAPEGTELVHERGIRNEAAATATGCDVTIGVYAHGRRRRATLSVRAVLATLWSQPLLLEIGPVDLGRPDPRALRGWARQVFATLSGA